MTVKEAIDVLKKDIKCLTDTPCSGPCKPEGCPYFIGDNDRVKAEQLAIEALEKQIPKKVVKVKGEIGGFYIASLFRDFLCPSCKKYLDYKQTYCNNCGQKIDWSEEQ